jgi:hypothetical protein
MVKLAPLVPHAIGARKLQIRIRAWVVAGPFTLHFCAPSFDVLLLRVDQDIPPLQEISSFSLPLNPLQLQRIVCDLPVDHTSPPLGTVTFRRKWSRRRVGPGYTSVLSRFFPQEIVFFSLSALFSL